nr:hypothetical protein [Tanacetum cinerariifolium]
HPLKLIDWETILGAIKGGDEEENLKGVVVVPETTNFPFLYKHPLTMYKTTSLPGALYHFKVCCQRLTTRFAYVSNNGDKPEFNCCSNCFLVEFARIAEVDAIKEEASIKLQHEGHPQHTLTLQLRPASFCCDACNVKDEGLFYECDSCDFWIHKNEWLYHCANCRYFAHIKCALNAQHQPRAPRDDLSTSAASEDVNSLLHFPMSEAFVDPLKLLQSRILAQDDMETTEINQWSHPAHPLILNVEDPQGNNMIPDINSSDPIKRVSILVMESLHVSFQKLIDRGMFDPIFLGKENWVPISHLFYADDAMFIGKWSRSNANVLMMMLHYFSLASGLKVNVHKSSIYGVGVRQADVQHMAENFGCISNNLPFTYLGVKVGVNMMRLNSWSDVVKNVSNKLSNWKAKTLSVGVIKSIHGNSGAFDNPYSSQLKNSTWIGILKAINKLKVKGVNLMGFCKIVIGNGGTIRFWHDIWYGDICFKEKSKRLFNLELQKDANVASKLQASNVASSFRRHPRSDLARLIGRWWNIHISIFDDPSSWDFWLNDILTQRARSGGAVGLVPLVKIAKKGQRSISALMKCTSAIRQLAYGCVPDSLEEYLQMGATTSRDSLRIFCKVIMNLYGEEFLRKPAYTDIEKLYAYHNESMDFLGC